ncbi:hypothetical protein ACLOJK_038064 [Asimina triloba]
MGFSISGPVPVVDGARSGEDGLSRRLADGEWLSTTKPESAGSGRWRSARLLQALDRWRAWTSAGQIGQVDAGPAGDDADRTVLVDGRAPWTDADGRRCWCLKRTVLEQTIRLFLADLGETPTDLGQMRLMKTLLRGCLDADDACEMDGICFRRRMMDDQWKRKKRKARSTWGDDAVRGDDDSGAGSAVGDGWIC